MESDRLYGNPVGLEGALVEVHEKYGDFQRYIGEVMVDFQDGQFTVKPEDTVSTRLSNGLRLIDTRRNDSLRVIANLDDRPDIEYYTVVESDPLLSMV